MKLQRALLISLTLGILGLSRVQAASTVDGSITVTPVATVSLALAPTTYSYGPVDVNTSSVSASALTLTNNGNVTVTVTKQIQTESSPVGWTASTSAGADTYVLYTSTSIARPATGDFIAATRFGAQANSTNLTGLTGTQPTIAPSSAVALWFKLDMPQTVTSQTGRTITVRFTATAQ